MVDFYLGDLDIQGWERLATNLFFSFEMQVEVHYLWTSHRSGYPIIC